MTNRYLPRADISALIAATIFLSIPILSYSASIEDLKNKIDSRSNDILEIEEEIKEYKKFIDETEAKAKTLNNQISIINAQTKKLGADIRLTDNQIQITELTINKLSIEIVEKEIQIEAKKDVIAELLRTIYELEEETILEIMLANNRISDFFGDVEYLTNLDSAVRDNLADLKSLKFIFENEKSQQIEEETRLGKLRTDFSARKQIKENNKQNKSTLLRNTKEQEAVYQKLLSQREKQRIEILAEIAEIENELRLLIDPETLPVKGSGVLGLPVENPFLTQDFGLTKFAKKRTDIYKGGGHNGVDFRASIGTPILASLDGRVLKTGNSDLSCPGGSYGKWILIEHSNNLATLYAHLSLISVANGDSVKAGARIGYSGNSGYTTGPHLHFTVYDSRTIRFGPSKSGRCKLLPYGGYLNPVDYLKNL